MFRVADVPFGIIGCDFFDFLRLLVDVSFQRLVETERSEFNDDQYSQVKVKTQAFASDKITFLRNV